MQGSGCRCRALMAAASVIIHIQVGLNDFLLNFYQDIGLIQYCAFGQDRSVTFCMAVPIYRSMVVSYKNMIPTKLNLWLRCMRTKCALLHRLLNAFHSGWPFSNATIYTFGCYCQLLLVFVAAFGFY